MLFAGSQAPNIIFGRLKIVCFISTAAPDVLIMLTKKIIGWGSELCGEKYIFFVSPFLSLVNRVVKATKNDTYRMTLI